MRYCRFLLIMLAMLVNVSMRAQYNPTNPDEPGTKPWQLTLKSVPSDVGSFNISRVTNHAEGEEVTLNAYNATGFSFANWEDEEGNILSNTSQYKLIMPAEHITLVARYSYNPNNPGEPDQPDQPDQRQYSRIFLQASPADGGSFNVSSGTRFEVGSVADLRASNRTDFAFENWTGNGEVISVNNSLKYTVKETDSYLTANFKYTPGNPGEPSEPSISHHLYLKANPSSGGYFNTSSDNSYVAGTSVRLTAYSNNYYQFRNWTQDGEIISSSASFTYVMPDKTVTLIANYDYIYSPDNPDEPGPSQTEHYYIYGMRENGLAGQTISYPVYLENTGLVNGFSIDLAFPLGFTINESGASLTSRTSGHTLEVKDLGNNSYRIQVRGAETIDGVNGKVVEIPVGIPDTATVGNVFVIGLSKGAVFKADGSQSPINVRDGSLKILRSADDTPDSPDYVVTNVQTSVKTVMPQDVIHIEWQVKNQGNLVGYDGWNERIYLESTSGKKVSIGSVYYETGSLAPNAVVSRSADITLAKLIGMDGAANVSVTIVPSVGSGEIIDYQANNTASTENTPLQVGKCLYLSLPEVSLVEGKDATVSCQLSRSGNWTATEYYDLKKLSGDDRLVVPDKITIPRDQSAAYFYLTINDNSTNDADSVFTVQVSGNGYEAVEGAIVVSDNDLASLQMIASKTEVTEGETFELTISLSKALATDLTVGLACDQAARFSFPKTITISAGQLSASIVLTAIDNTEPNNEETVSFIATADGFSKASAFVVLNDNDVPEIDLILTPSEVSENAGANAVYATLRRTTVTNNKVTIRFSDDKEGRLIYPTTVVLENGTTEKNITIGVIDNDLVDGECVVNITAEVFISSCNCGVVGNKQGSVTRQLHILDNDGPTLSLSSTLSVIREGDPNGTVVTLKRNTSTDKHLVVSLQSESEDIEMPSQVTIPLNESSTTFVVKAKANDLEEGNRVVTIRANAENYNSGTLWLYVTDMTLPDMAVKSIAVSPKDIVAGDEYAVDVTIANIGVVEVPARSTYTISAAGEVLTMTIAEAIPTMGEKTAHLTFKAPNVPGDYSISVECNKGRAFEEVQTLNNISSVPLFVNPLYFYSVSTDREIYQIGETVKISGEVVALKGGAAGVSVEPYVICHGMRISLSAIADETGKFSAEYVLPAGMGGDFAVGACTPGENATDASTMIHVYGMARTNATYIKTYMAVGTPYFVRVPIKNLSSLPLHHIKTTVTDNAGHYDVTGKEIDLLEGMGNTELELTMRSDEVSTASSWERVQVQLISEEGATLSFVLYNYTNTQQALLVVDTPVISANIAKSKPLSVPVVLTNKGLGETGLITIGVSDNQNFFSMLTPKEIPSLSARDSTIMILQFNPVGLDVNVIQKGSIAINCENADGILISYSLKVVSEEQGNLLVRVQDEFTIYGDAEGNHPYVSNANVCLKDYNTGKVLFEGTTDAEGKKLFNNVPEGFYTLFVTAQKHDSYIQNVYVSPGETTEHLASISYQAISISYSVEETTTEDRYLINPEIEFETQVPVPVVVMDMPDELDLYSVEQGNEQLFYITLTNHGLITANNVCVSLPQREGFVFTPLVEYAGLDLAPMQSYSIPVYVTLDEEAKNSPNRIKSSEFEWWKMGCYGTAYASWEWVCKGLKTALIGKALKFLLSSCDPDDLPIIINIEPKVILIDIPEPPDEPDDPEDIWLYKLSRTVSQLDLYGAYQFTSWLFCSLSCLGPIPPIPILGPIMLGSTALCILQELGPHAPARMALNKTGYMDDTKEQYIEKMKLLIHLDTNRWNYYSELVNASKLEEDVETFSMLLPSFDGILDVMTSMHEQNILYSSDVKGVYDKVIGLMPQQCADWYDFNLNSFIERQINTFRLMDNLSVEDDNHCDIARLATFRDSIAIYEQEIVDMGFVDRYDLIASINEDAEIIAEASSNVCASVTVQLEQEMVFTRQAFRGRLIIENSTESDLTDISAFLIITDENGNLATSHEMQISLESAEGFTPTAEGVYSLGAGQTGIFSYLFIPTRYAAESHDVVYNFGGSLTYDDGDGKKTHTLYPASLTVRPTPVLDMTYFMQRDIYGDDPLTEAIEPIVPAEFTVLINNKGYGEASNVRMTTQQPKIVENEKGLLVDFQFVSSQINGGDAALSFGEEIANDFGTIPARSQAYGQWWLTSTLLGHFVSYDVTATHLTSYGNEDLSLLDKVTIHQLIHGFTAKPDAEIPIRGFLVNDIPDADDMPDEVYFTDATLKSVNKAGYATFTKRSDTEFLLNVSPSAVGWNYGSLTDPTYGKQELAAIRRLSDNAEIPLDNVWQTHYTLRDGKDPVHENRIHFVFDLQEGGDSYLLSFELKPDVVLKVECFKGNVEENETLDKPLEEISVLFNKPINSSTFTYEDVSLSCQGKKLDASKIGITNVSNAEYKLNLAPLTKQNGFYVLTVYTDDIMDNEGFMGSEGKQFTWIQNDGSGIDEIMADGDLQIIVAPNPIGDKMYISGSFNSIENMYVHDVNGLLRMQCQDVAPGQCINVSDMPTGFYILTIETDIGTGKVKVVKI